MTSLLKATWIAPLVSVVLLVGMWIEGRFHAIPAANIETYHGAIRRAADDIPYEIEVRAAGAKRPERWHGEDREIPVSSITLLKPNVTKALEYRNLTTGESATFVMVQCADARDMGGHYPPKCYRAHGFREGGRDAREIVVDDRTFQVSVYDFTLENGGEYQERTIYNFFVMPDGSVQRGLGGVRKAAADRHARPLGAAQFQVIFNDPMTESRRDEVFRAVVSGILLDGSPYSLLDAVGAGER